MLVVIYTDRGIITHRGHLSTDRGINTADYDSMTYITSIKNGKYLCDRNSQTPPICKI